MKTLLITGVSGSLGSRMASRFLARGEKIIGLDLRQPDLPSPETGSLVFRTCDLCDPSQVESVIEDLTREHGAPDVSINGAGKIYNSPVLILDKGQLQLHDFDEWRAVIETNLNATFFVAAVCAREMIKHRKRGLILNIGSISAAGNAGQAAYSAAKAGISAMTMSLAKELGPLGVRVAAIAPGYIDVGSTRDNVPDSALQAVKSRTPGRALGSVEDFLDAVDFVIENAYFCGKTLELDGGLTL